MAIKEYFVDYTEAKFVKCQPTVLEVFLFGVGKLGKYLL